MIKLDKHWLAALGLDALPVAQANALLEFVYIELEMRVGAELASQMSTRQLDEFEAFIDAQDEAGALAWLEETFPDYRDVVRVAFEAMSAELSGLASDIRAASLVFDPKHATNDQAS